MARSQANLQFGVFDGLRGLGDVEKLLYFAVLVEPTVNQAGVGALRLSRWAKQLEKPVAEVEKALMVLDEKRYVLFDEDTEEILVRTLIRNDGVASQPNVLWAAVKAAAMTQSPRLRRALASELRRLPPKPADKVNQKTGRVFVHPDPYACADELDPRPSTTPPEPSANPSRSHVEPSRNEGFPKGSRTPGGGGGGGGGGSSSVVGHFGGSRAHARERPPQELANPRRCATHAAISDGEPVPNCGACAEIRRTSEQRIADAFLLQAESKLKWRATVDACGECDHNGKVELSDGSMKRHHPEFDDVRTAS